MSELGIGVVLGTQNAARCCWQGHDCSAGQESLYRLKLICSISFTCGFLFKDTGWLALDGIWWTWSKQMKFMEPTKGKGFRTLFRKAGYPVYLVDEYRTSARCHYCKSDEGICEKFRSCKSPRPWKKNETILRHGLLRCKTCGRLWNRDLNGSLNIHKVMVDTISGKDRPAYLKRTNHFS